MRAAHGALWVSLVCLAGCWGNDDATDQASSPCKLGTLRDGVCVASDSGSSSTDVPPLAPPAFGAGGAVAIPTMTAPPPPLGGASSTQACDPSVAASATCGDLVCPIAPAAAPPCTVPCCAGEVCGFRGALMDMVTQCSPSPQHDPACPDYVGASTTLRGCCYDGVTCGFISAAGDSCIVSSAFLADLAEQAGARCSDDEDGGVP